MRTPILFFIVLLFFTACQNAKEHKVVKVPDNTQNNQLVMIDSLMSLSAERGVFNGNILVAKNNELIYQKEFGYTDGSKSKENHPNSLFNIGSIAKEFNAVGIMLLEEKGVLKLDDKISKYNLDLPQWADSVSISNLLQYTSGLPRVNWRNIKSDEDIYNDLKNIKQLNFEVGTNYLYSNHNIFLQRRIIEKVSNMSFNDFVQKNILTPSGMNDTRIDPNPDSSELVTAFNNEFVNDKTGDVKISGWVNPTIKDMYKWLASLHSGKLIKKKSLVTLFDSHAQNTESALGHGVFENEKLSIHRHHGSHFNYESLVYYNVQEDLMIILMTNNKNFQLDNIARAIQNISNEEPFSAPQKSVYLTIREKCYQDVEAGIDYYKTLKKNYPEVYNFSNESELNRVGYKLIEKEQLDDAIKIFKLLISEFPNSANPYDSIGEAYHLNGNNELALVNFKKSLELNPDNANAKKMIEELNKF